MKRIINKEDWDWYKQELDGNGRYKHYHIGSPHTYPCLVESSFYDNPNGPYEYIHEFFYQEKHICESCGHEELKYPVPKENIEE